MTTDFQRGLKAAAGWLTATAEDFEQSSKQMQHYPEETRANKSLSKEYAMKAQLLRGQAGHVLNIKDIR